MQQYTKFYNQDSLVSGRWPNQTIMTAQEIWPLLKEGEAVFMETPALPVYSRGDIVLTADGFICEREPRENNSRKERESAAIGNIPIVVGDVQAIVEQRNQQVIARLNNI